MLIVACICIAALLVAFPSRGNKNFLEMATADKPEDGVTRRSSFFEEATESSPADDGASSTARTRRHKHRKRRTTTTTTDESADEVTGRSYNDRIQEWTIDASEPDRATSNASEGWNSTATPIGESLRPPSTKPLVEKVDANTRSAKTMADKTTVE
ncbi:uncharacterized protein LOC144107484 isoform X2 [Amblyomma americanum]